MSLNYVNRSNDEEIIDIVRSVLDNGTGKAETFNEHVLIKLMQIRGTPIENMSFDQERVDKLYHKWLSQQPVHNEIADVALLTRYVIHFKHIGDDYETNAVVSKNGDWVKFEEAVEASSNSLQQLKAEIAEQLDKYEKYRLVHPELADIAWWKLRKLSVVNKEKK